MSKAGIVAGFTLLILFWLGARIGPCYPLVFSDAESPLLLGNDPWFHFHQTSGAVEHFPHLLRSDVGSNYPRGVHSAPAGLFHLFAAAVALVLGGGSPPPDLIKAVLAWSPIVFGVTSLLFFYALAREWGGHRLALVALSLRVLFPGSELDRTVLGMGDHHAVEICLATMGLWLFLRYFRTTDRGKNEKREWLRAWGAGLPFALFLFVWAGAPLHLAMLVAAVWIAWIIGMVRGLPEEGSMGRMNRYFVSLCLSIAFLGWLFPEWIMNGAVFRATLAGLTLQIFLGGIAGAYLVKAGTRIGRKKGVIAAVTVGAALGAGLIVFSFVPFRDLAGHIMVNRNPFIAEHRAVDGALLWETYGLVGLWVVPGFSLVLRKTLSFGQRFVFIFLLAWCLLCLASSDFAYLVSALLPLVMAIGMMEWPALFTRMEKVTGGVRCLLPLSAVLVTAFFLMPTGKVRLPFLFRSDIEGMVVATAPWRDAMKWLREESPKPPISPTHLAPPWEKRRGFDYPPGSYGVLSHWQFGNLIPALGERFAVSARTRSGTFIEWFLEQDEVASLARLGRKGDVRYVILDAGSVGDSFPGEAIQAGMERDDFQIVEETITLDDGDIELLSFGEDFRRAVGARLYLGDGPGMERYRLVYESPQQSFLRYRAFPDIRAVELRATLIRGEAMREKVEPLTASGESWTEPGPYFCYSGQMTSAVKIFERVRGATLRGIVEPSATATLELKLFSPFTGRHFTYRQSGTADGEGSIRFTVPYPAGETPAADRIHSVSLYQLFSGGKASLAIKVTEEQVSTGANVFLPTVPTYRP